MFMRPTQFSPQITYDPDLLGEEAPAKDVPWYQKLLDVAPQVAAARTQYQLVRAQIKAQERGLDPSASALRVQTGLDENTRRMLTYAGIGAAALAAAFLLRR